MNRRTAVLAPSIGAEISAGRYAYVDRMPVIRHGRIAFDRSYEQDYDLFLHDGQFPVIMTEQSAVVAFNGWNILPGRPSFPSDACSIDSRTR